MNRSGFSGSINSCRPKPAQASWTGLRHQGPAQDNSRASPSSKLQKSKGQRCPHWPSAVGCRACCASTCPKEGKVVGSVGPHATTPGTAAKQQKPLNKDLTHCPRSPELGFPGATVGLSTSPDTREQDSLRPFMKCLQSTRWGLFSCPHLSPKPAMLAGCESPAERKSHLAVLILAAWSLTGRISWGLTFRAEASPGPGPQSGGSFQERITTGAHRMWGSEPQGKAFKRTETRKGEPGLQQLISKLAEGGAAHIAASPADLHREGERGNKAGAGAFLNEGSRDSPGKGTVGPGAEHSFVNWWWH